MLKNSQKEEIILEKTINDAMKMYPNLEYDELRSILLKPLGENIVALASRVKALEHEVVKHLTN